MPASQRTTSIRLSSTIAKRLDRLARVMDRPKSQLINKALEEYLEDYEDYLVAAGRLNDKNDTIISEKEMRKKLAKSLLLS
ncbi:MAG: ribbon-helix-helix domain-containing protein [Nitrososphaerales archaeon]|jgi:predicted DNA-binding protein